MKKKLLTVAAVVLAVVVCLVALVGCDSSARNVKYLHCRDFLYETNVNITLSKRLPKVGFWNSDINAIKYGKSLAELYELMQMQDGYTKMLFNDYILIETTQNDRLYTWGIFSSSILGDDYNGEYNYVLTSMGVNGSSFFFPIYTMEHPLLVWEEKQQYACNVTLDALLYMYARHGFTTEVEGNVVKVATPVQTSDNQEVRTLWEITFHSNGSVSVDNCLQEVTIYD